METISRAEFERGLKKIAHSRITSIIQQSKQTINTMAKKAKAKKSAAKGKSASKKKAAPVKVNLIESSAHLKSLATEVEAEVVNYTEKGVKASARRARKGLMEMRKLAQAMRKGIQEVVNKNKGK